MTDHEWLRELSARVRREDEQFGDYDTARLDEIADRLIRMEAANDIMDAELKRRRKQ
jgi:hypothetical protein